MPSYTSHTARSSPGKTQGTMTAPHMTIQSGLPRQKDNDESLLEMLTSTVACLKLKHMDIEAIGCLEQSLWLKRRMFGVDNTVVHKALSDVVLSYNSIAMQYLAQGQFEQCLAMLRKAEAITAPGNFKKCQSLQILTFNNIGCCYRKLGKLKSALKYLKEAAQIGSSCAHVKNLSITHLNLCAIQSQLGRHDLALEHAQAAIFHTQEELVSMEERSFPENKGRENENDSENGTDALDAKSREEKIVSLAVAYHNLAVELEFNGRGEASLQWYKKALQLVWKYRETNEALCASFKNIFLEAKKKQEPATISVTGRISTSASASSRNASRSGVRPKSAHASTRVAAGRANVSYSATVAAQCYKPVKPSQAGLQYSSPTKASSAIRVKQQRPSSAHSYRQRPLSTSTADHSRRTRPNVACADDGSMIDAHWKRLERELSIQDNKSATVKRPHSARAASRTLTQPPGNQRQKQELCFSGHEDDFANDGEDLGVIDDDGSDDGDDHFAEFLIDGQNAKPNSHHPVQNGNSQYDSTRRTIVQRHRKALNDSRMNESFDDEQELFSETGERNEDASSVSSAGYRADTDARGEFNEDPDLPNQRVGHLEYLRRMKKIAESIKNDLSDAATPKTSAKARPLLMTTQTAEEELSPNTTPRGTSKVRSRLERARSDSVHDLNQEHATESETAIATGRSDAMKRDEPVLQTTSCNPGAAQQLDKPEQVWIDIKEDVYVFQDECDILMGERGLVQAAAVSRIQATGRGGIGRTRVRSIKQVTTVNLWSRLKNVSSKRIYVQEITANEAARLIQSRAKVYLELAKERYRVEEENAMIRLQKEEVEDMAASLIQELYRHKYHRIRKKSELDRAMSPVQSLPASSQETTRAQTQKTTSRSSSLLSSQHAAATRIQAVMKGSHDRDQVRRLQARRLSRSYIERNHMGISLERAVRSFPIDVDGCNGA